MANIGPWTRYNEVKYNLGLRLMDMTADTFNVALVTSGSNALDPTLTGAVYSAISGELPDGNGYTTGGATVPSQTWTLGALNACAFSVGDVIFTGIGAGLTAYAAVAYNATTGHLIAYCLLDNTPADYVLAPGAVLKLTGSNLFILA